jgi:hypothetical protein
MGTSITKFRLFFSQNLLHCQHTYSILLETLYAGRVKLFAEASEFFSCALFQLVVLRKSSSEFILQGMRKNKISV